MILPVELSSSSKLLGSKLVTASLPLHLIAALSYALNKIVQEIGSTISLSVQKILQVILIVRLNSPLAWKYGSHCIKFEGPTLWLNFPF